ncbi:hypothetical protein ACVWXM_000478 [Bradyrhizobium sp. GM7.3]
MRRKQRSDEDHVDDETQWPWALREHQIDGDAAKSEAQSELEIHEAPAERQTVKESERRKAGEMDPSLPGPFEQKRASDDQQLAQEQKQARGVLDVDQPRHSRDQQIHSKVGIECPGHFVIRIGIGSAVLAQNVHPGEMIGIVDHRGDRGQQHRKKRQGRQDSKNADRRRSVRAKTSPDCRGRLVGRNHVIGPLEFELTLYDGATARHNANNVNFAKIKVGSPPHRKEEPIIRRAARGFVLMRLRRAGYAGYFIAALIELNLLLRSALPVLFTAVMIASAMPVAIRQYSMAVAPFSSARNDLSKVIVNSCSSVQPRLVPFSEW